ncbi:MAG: hypothetical protein SOZ59_14295 [Candidatus Limivivens sp.]|nr:hypothetical protein [Candidatus Limivivens sp.]
MEEGKKGREGLLHLLDMMSSDAFDLEAYGKSESLTGILENQECMLSYPEEGCAEVLNYWEERGLKKELHQADCMAEKWASYLPLSYVNGNDPGRHYPLLFVMHGSGNPIYLAESYGYTHIAAREEVIVIIPETETVEKIEELFAYAKEHYPVDWSRVYMVGYSLGGFMTSRHGIRWPERFAAVGIGGMLFANGPTGVHRQNDVYWPGETITPEMVGHAAEVKLPVCVCMGEQEILGLLPVTEDEPPFTPPGGDTGEKTDRIDLSGKNKIASVNNWRQIAGCSRIPEEKVREEARFSADIVTEKLGFPFERTSVILRENRSHFVGDCVNPAGENLARFICMGKSAHWPSRALTELTWEFIRQFSRDPETGCIRINEEL